MIILNVLLIIIQLHYSFTVYEPYQDLIKLNRYYICLVYRR